MALADEVQIVQTEDLRSWLADSPNLSRYAGSIGSKEVSGSYLEDELRMPLHLQFTIKQLVRENRQATMDDLSSLPFYSLCKGLFLPLSGMQPDKSAYLFGIQTEPPPDAQAREALLERFIDADCGLSLPQKLSSILGDPFRGKPATLKRDSLVRLLLSMELTSRRQVLDKLTRVGDVSVLFAQHRPELKVAPPLTAAEVLETLRCMALPGVKRTMKFDILRSLLGRCGKVEAYFVAKLVLRKAGFGFDYQGGLIARVLARAYGATPEQVAHAMALTDAFNVASTLANKGPAGLQAIQLQPLVPVRPALASGHTEKIKQFPVWVERKYDGIRFMLHKATDQRGAVLCGAYTRNRRDWLEMVSGLDQTIRYIPAKSVILDGELYGTVLDLEGARPATVYEVYGSLQGEVGRRPVQLKFAAFDIVYLNGQDLTQLPLPERRRRLQMVISPMGNWPLPVTVQMAEGQMANDMNDVNRLYHHFRSQGYEGVITKSMDTPYMLATRDSNWLKRKPEITLDLVLLAGVFAVTEKTNVGVFGSYAIGARGPGGAFVDVGDVAGVDKVRDAEIQGMIMRDGLITGRRIERQSSSGKRPGIELVPGVVVTVRFEGVIRDSATEELKLRDPKLVAIRSDKGAAECNTTKDIEQLYLRQRVG